MQIGHFVNKKSVNADPLPTISPSAPSFDVREKICTFADVEERPHSDTPTPEGRRQMFSSLVLYIMAKSKSGGTRSYIRGRVGADVYSIGKDAKGKKQQVVRSLAESVANPQTESQMRGRMIMSTVMQAESALAFIVDHSFDNVPNGQPSLSEFIRRNYALVKADVAAHPASGNSFGLNKYQEKGILAGPYVIADGDAASATGIELDPDFGSASITVPAGTTAETMTVAILKQVTGLSDGDYFTLLAANGTDPLKVVRIHIPEGKDTEVIGTEESFKQILAVEMINGGASLTFNLVEGVNNISIGFSESRVEGLGAITSRKNVDGWKHNKAVMTAGQIAATTAADAVLPTYPVGAARFLNGGDI